ncbi:kinesin-like protein KIF14 isoform X1 [Pseudomyrmex gracilis]|uniref:kinesin-like protein KIF14 isoform X1 n=1 Tax=Pseudomyrmex gracilis TaxID=219809 RepID=UPI000995564D|nr:kinesin-like protein KIF14 isoform X1 [Pseudomyrmex gracilis]
MSYHSMKSSAHGYCEAIFSTSPRNSNKENAVPVAKANKSEFSSASNETAASSKNQSAMKKTQQCPFQKVSKQDITETLGPPKKIPSNTDLSRSKSATSAKQEDAAGFGSTTSNDKAKTPSVRTKFTSGLSGDKAVHFSTPKPSKATNTPCASTVKFNLLPSTRTPIKHYFSDHALSQNTPDCFNAVHLETPSHKPEDTAVSEQTIYEGESSNLTVGIRIRPLNSKELNDPKVAIVVQGNGQNVIVECDSTEHTFTYDHCFVSYNDPITPGHASQAIVFQNMVLPLVQNAFEGYNVCLFAYGQTGSGKSYSVMGTESAQLNDENVGIIPRFCQEIFTRADSNKQIETTVEISYFEIYNEKIHDLLASTSNGSKKAPLKVREHPVFGPYVVDLSQHCVQNYKDLQTWLKVGNSQRATAATGMNEKSSRSHSIFSIVLTQSRSKDQLDSRQALDTNRRSKINLVDLAGSERLSQTSATGDRLREGVSINKSLLTLGKVIATLTENTNNRKQGFVPYRESVLTWLLKESLGGNSRTAMLGTVSPANIHVEETLATLRYACQARAIVNRIRVNEDSYDRLIRELKAEKLRLRTICDTYEKQLGISGITPRRLLDCFEPPPAQSDGEIKRKQKEIDKLRGQLKKTEEQLAVTQMNWREKLRRAEEKKSSELKYLRRCGIAIEYDFHERNKQPCLVNLSADPMLSGTLLYLIPPGLVRIGKNVGSENASKKLDIILDGPLVRELHCVIENNGGKLILIPEKTADTYVNGQIISGKIILNHGDRLIIGGNHYFKVLNPHDDQPSNVKQVIDYDFAHQEILRVQEQKLRTELEESKQKAIKELEDAKREVELQLCSQKSNYENKIQSLSFTVEKQKEALEKINRRKEELELEKELLATEVETNNKIKNLELEESKAMLSPYKSNFLEELVKILNDTTADAESALKTEVSKVESITAGGISLHEMQVLVKEATQRCKEGGFKYEFDQQQIVVEKNLRPVVRVRDTARVMETLWQPADFLDWIHRLRNCDIADSIKELQKRECDWEPYKASENSLNNRRISINMTPVKKQLNESLHHLSMDASMLEVTLNDRTSVTTHNQTQEDIKACLTQIEIAAKTLNKLCSRNPTYDNKSVVESLSKIQDIVEILKNIFKNQDSSDEASASTISSNNTVIHVINDTKTSSLNKEDKNKCEKKNTNSANDDINRDKPLTESDVVCNSSSEDSLSKFYTQSDLRQT